MDEFAAGLDLLILWLVILGLSKGLVGSTSDGKFNNRFISNLKSHPQ